MVVIKKGLFAEAAFIHQTSQTAELMTTNVSADVRIGELHASSCCILSLTSRKCTPAVCTRAIREHMQSPCTAVQLLVDRSKDRWGRRCVLSRSTPSIHCAPCGAFDTREWSTVTGHGLSSPTLMTRYTTLWVSAQDPSHERLVKRPTL